MKRNRSEILMRLTTNSSGTVKQEIPTDATVKWSSVNLPPINLNNSLSADNFYPDDTYNKDSRNLGEADANHQDS